MPIKELTTEILGKAKSGWRWDKKRKLWITFQVDTTYHGSRHVRRGFRTEQDAKDYLEELKLRERMREIGAVPPVNFPKAAELFQKYSKSLQSNSERVRANRVTKTFLKLLPTGATIDEIARKHGKDYIDRRVSDGVKPETADRELNVISAALNKAGDYYAALENWNAPRLYRPPLTDDTRQRIITREEREKLIEYLLRKKKKKERPIEFCARRRAGLILYFALLTGLRHGEICGLEKVNFNPKEKRLKAERFKTKRSGLRWTVFEPLTDTQLWVLEEAEKLYPDGKFLFSENGKIHQKIYKMLKAACKKLKIPYGRNTAGGLIVHDARHTFVTALEQNAVDSSTTRSFSGHSKDTMLKRYAHATPGSRARALDVIEKKFGREPGSKEKQLHRIFKDVKAGKIEFGEFEQRVKDFFTVF